MATAAAEYADLAAEYEAYRATHPEDPDPVPVPPPDQGGARVLWEADFSDLPKGPFTQAMARDKFGPDWDVPNDEWWADHHVSIAISDGISVLDVELQAGAIGGGGGVVFFSGLPDEVVEATFEMEHQFAPGFELDMGGKLPGIGSTTDPNISPPTGGDEPTNGSTCRHMWRTGGEATSGGNDYGPGAAAVYTYHPDKTEETWGDYEFLDANFTVGEWDLITTRVRYNDPGESNGILQSRKGYDPGPWTLDRTDYLWRPDDTWLINRFCFAVFRGGNTDDWASDTIGRVQFRRFRVTTPA
jgi:Polysaccharide lyase 14